MTTTEAEFLRATEQPLECTLIDIVRAAARKSPEAEVTDDDEVVVTYAELINEINFTAMWLYEQGIRRGDHIGARMSSEGRGLYMAISSIMTAGATYVSVDADDPDERAKVVLGEAGIAGYFDVEDLHLAGFTAHNHPRSLDSDADSNEDSEEAESAPSSVHEVISQRPTPDDDC